MKTGDPRGKSAPNDLPMLTKWSPIFAGTRARPVAGGRGLPTRPIACGSQGGGGRSLCPRDVLSRSRSVSLREEAFTRHGPPTGVNIAGDLRTSHPHHTTIVRRLPTMPNIRWSVAFQATAIGVLSWRNKTCRNASAMRSKGIVRMKSSLPNLLCCFILTLIPMSGEWSDLLLRARIGNEFSQASLVVGFPRVFVAPVSSSCATPCGCRVTTSGSGLRTQPFAFH